MTDENTQKKPKSGTEKNKDDIFWLSRHHGSHKNATPWLNRIIVVIKERFHNNEVVLDKKDGAQLPMVNIDPPCLLVPIMNREI